jgi:hypothetical protein
MAAAATQKPPLTDKSVLGFARKTAQVGRHELFDRVVVGAAARPPLTAPGQPIISIFRIIIFAVAHDDPVIPRGLTVFYQTKRFQT